MRNQGNKNCFSYYELEDRFYSSWFKTGKIATLLKGERNRYLTFNKIIKNEDL